MASKKSPKVLCEEPLATIPTLPDEVWTIILCDEELNCKDVLNFGETCKLHNEMVKENQIIWKNKLKSKLPHRIATTGIFSDNKDWLTEVKDYYKIQTKVFKEVLTLCSRFYKQDIFMNLKDVEVFFSMACAKKENYYIVTSVLCKIINRGKELTKGTSPAPRPYNFSDMYFAKKVARFLIHTYMMIQWVTNFKLDLLTPEYVVHFFHQWIDSSNIHLTEIFRERLETLIKSVEVRLEANHPFQFTSQAQRQIWRNGTLHNNAWKKADCLKLMDIIKIVLYDEKPLKNRFPLNLRTPEEALDIVTVIDTRIGTPTIIAALFSCLCRRFGVRCDLITFSDHMYLEWREDYDDPETESFTVNLANGYLEKKRRCPFSQAERNSYKYIPDNLLTHLYGAFIRSMGDVKNWSIENVYCLYEFLRTDHAHDNQVPYKNFMLYLMTLSEAEIRAPLCMWNMDKKHLDIIYLLVNMHRHKGMAFKVVAKPHYHRVKFAVGMILYHLKYDYVCVVKGWDTQCNATKEWQDQMAVSSLQFGPKQPYYQVQVADYSERYVAQEHLREMTPPNRLHHLEDALAPEFLYFDGYAYVPNEMKVKQYPTDGPVREMYKNKRAQPPT